MRVSGKITHSFYLFLHGRGFNTSRLFELTPLEMEFLKDPDQWIDISQVESFLKQLQREYAPHFVDQDFLSGVGHSCPELGAWGELDSVLKMRKAERGLFHFANVPVFLSYFISDGFSLISERARPGFLSFKCNLSSDDYPCVTEYLRSALESLPIYSNKPRAEVKWIRDYIQIKWEDESTQTSLFPDDSEINIKPELLTDLRQFLEKVEETAYSQRQKILAQEKQIRNLKDQMLLQGITQNVSVLIQEMEQKLLTMKKELNPSKLSAETNPELFAKGKTSALQQMQKNLYPQIEDLLNTLHELKALMN